MSAFLVAGETLVDLVPGPGETLRDVDGFAHRPGGAPANVAVGLARLGSPPAFWTRLADDAFGDFLAETLADEGIPDAHVRRVDGETTLAVVSPPGVDGPRFGFYGSRDATLGFDPDAVPTDALTPRDAASRGPWVHVGGVALTHPRGRRATAALLSAATARDCPVSVDLNHRPALVPDGDADAVLAAVRETVAASDVVLCSEAEVPATGLSTSEGAALARDLIELGPHTAAATRGADGALAVSSEAAPWGPASVGRSGFDVDAVDATGAGDAFTAGLLAGLSGVLGGERDDADGRLRGAVTFANATAALSVRAVGGANALPTREAVASFLAGRNET